MRIYKNETIRDQQNLALVPCHVCGSAEHALLGIDNGFRVVKCAQVDCGYVFVNPRPTRQQLKSFYDNFYPMGNDTAVALTKEMVQINREVACILKKFSVTGHVLDIGSSFGQFLAEVEKIGWEGTGVEPSSLAASYSKAHTKCRIVQGFIENTELEPNTFDAIVSLYVLEHVLEPYKFMERVYRLLRPGGIAVIRVPHAEPLMPLNRLIGLPLFHAPMHLNDFSPHTLKKIATAAGFSKCDAAIGARRRPSKPVEYLGVFILGGAAQFLEFLTFGKYLFPFSGSKQYTLIK